MVGDKLIELVNYLNSLGEKGKYIIVNTNGVYIRKYINKLKDSGISILKISLDTLDRQKFHTITGRDNLLQVLEGVNLALEAKIAVGLNMVYTKQNFDDVWNLIDYCSSRNIPELKILDLVQNGDEDYWLANYISPGDLIDKLKSRYGESEASYLTGNRGVAMQKFRVSPSTVVEVKDSRVGSTYSGGLCTACHLFPCQEGFYNLTLNTDGKLKPCRIRTDVVTDVSRIASEITAENRVQYLVEILRSALEQYYSTMYFSNKWGTNILRSEARKD